jgi:hypothetical protein
MQRRIGETHGRAGQSAVAELPRLPTRVGDAQRAGGDKAIE